MPNKQDGEKSGATKVNNEPISLKSEEAPATSKAAEQQQPGSSKALEKADSPKVLEKPGPSKPETIKVKPKDGKKKLESKPAQTDLLAKKTSRRRRSRSAGTKKGKKGSGSRSTSLPPYPKYKFEKFLDKSNPMKILEQWIEREHKPLDDWEIVGTVVKESRKKVNLNAEEESSDADSTGSKEDQEAKPKVNEKEEAAAAKPKSKIGAADEKSANGNPMPEEAVVGDAKQAAEKEIVVLHKGKGASIATGEVHSSDDENK